jgi:hypothetical protein
MIAKQHSCPFFFDKWESHTKHLSDAAYRDYHQALGWMWQHADDRCSIRDNLVAWGLATGRPDRAKDTLAEDMQQDMPLLRREEGRLVSNGLRKAAIAVEKISAAGRKAITERWLKSNNNRNKNDIRSYNDRNTIDIHPVLSCPVRSDPVRSDPVRSDPDPDHKQHAHHPDTTRVPPECHPSATRVSSGYHPASTAKEHPFMRLLDAHEGLSGEAFRTAWEGWISYRVARRSKMTRQTAEAQLRKLAALPVEDAIACINASIEHGWIGLFPEQVQKRKDGIDEIDWSRIDQIAAGKKP